MLDLVLSDTKDIEVTTNSVLVEHSIGGKTFTVIEVQDHDSVLCFAETVVEIKGKPEQLVLFRVVDNRDNFVV